MSYQIVRFNEEDVDRIMNFQFATRKESVQKRVGDLSTRLLYPALRCSLVDAAGIRMLYAAVIPETTEVLAFVAGYSPGACLENEKLKRMMSLTQDALDAQYILFVHLFAKRGVDQKNIFALLLDQIIKQAYFFEFERIVIPVGANPELQSYLYSLEFHLADTFFAERDKPAINLLCQYVT